MTKLFDEISRNLNRNTTWEKKRLGSIESKTQNRERVLLFVFHSIRLILISHELATDVRPVRASRICTVTVLFFFSATYFTHSVRLFDSNSKLNLYFFIMQIELKQKINPKHQGWCSLLFMFLLISRRVLFIRSSAINAKRFSVKQFQNKRDFKVTESTRHSFNLKTNSGMNTTKDRKKASSLSRRMNLRPASSNDRKTTNQIIYGKFSLWWRSTIFMHRELHFCNPLSIRHEPRRLRRRRRCLLISISMSRWWKKKFYLHFMSCLKL